MLRNLQGVSATFGRRVLLYLVLLCDKGIKAGFMKCCMGSARMEGERMRSAMKHPERLHAGYGMWRRMYQKLAIGPSGKESPRIVGFRCTELSSKGLITPVKGCSAVHEWGENCRCNRPLLCPCPRLCRSSSPPYNSFVSIRPDDKDPLVVEPTSGDGSCRLYYGCVNPTTGEVEGKTTSYQVYL